MEQEQQKQYLHMLEEHIQKQSKYVEEVRRIKHDMYAHLIVMSCYLKDNNIQSAKEYLDKLMIQQSGVKPSWEDIGNEVCNAIINSILEKAPVPVGFTHKGLLPEELYIDTPDLSVLFSNLFSNAVEACVPVEDECRRIEMKIEEKGEYITIVLGNSFQGIREYDVIGKGTTKADKRNHGFGLGNIQSVVKKYDGEFSYKIVDDFFRVQVTLKNVDVARDS